MIKDLLKNGFVLKSKGFYKHAIESFYKALELDSSSLELLLEIADTYYLMGDEERAINYIEQVLDKNPAHIESLRLLKKIFLDKGAYSEAEQTAKNIFLITKDSLDLAEIFSIINKQKKYSEIFEYKSEAASVEILYEKAFAKFSLNEFDEAESFINLALESEPFNNKFLLLKGRILFRAGKKEEGISVFEKIDKDYRAAAYLNFSGLVNRYKKDLRKALENFLNALKLEPKEDEYYYNCASTYFKLGDMQLAKKYYNIAISLNPENQRYHFALANLYYAQKNYKRALEELVSATVFEARLLKSIILYDTGYLALAKIELEKLTEEQPENEIVQEYKSKIEKDLKI